MFRRIGIILTPRNKENNIVWLLSVSLGDTGFLMVSNGQRSHKLTNQPTGTRSFRISNYITSSMTETLTIEASVQRDDGFRLLTNIVTSD